MVNQVLAPEVGRLEAIIENAYASCFEPIRDLFYVSPVFPSKRQGNVVVLSNNTVTLIQERQ
jgi:hypothetical protein